MTSSTGCHGITDNMATVRPPPQISDILQDFSSPIDRKNDFTKNVNQDVHMDD